MNKQAVLEAILTILKYGGALLASAYGLYATLTDFKEEKNGKKVLSRHGKRGIAILFASSMLALSTSVVKDVLDKIQQAKAREEQRKLVGKLDNQIKLSKGVSTQLGKAVGTLGTNLTTTQEVSSTLKGAARSLGDVSQTTTDVLKENTGRIDTITVELSLLVNPFLLKDDLGNNIFSVEILDALTSTRSRGHESDKIGGLQEEIKEEILDSLQRNYEVARKRILSRWFFWFALSKADFLNSNDFERLASLNLDTSKIDRLFWGRQYFSGIEDFQFNYEMKNAWFIDRDDKERHWAFAAIPISITYQLPPNRLSGVRKYSDLNGLSWGIFLVLNRDTVCLDSVSLYTGKAGEVERSIKLTRKPGVSDRSEAADLYMEEKYLENGMGLYRARARIPSHHFR